MCICIILEISSLLSKNYPGFRCAYVMGNLISRFAYGFCKGGQFLGASGNKFQSLMVARKKSV